MTYNKILTRLGSFFLGFVYSAAILSSLYGSDSTAHNSQTHDQTPSQIWDNIFVRARESNTSIVITSICILLCFGQAFFEYLQLLKAEEELEKQKRGTCENFLVLLVIIPFTSVNYCQLSGQGSILKLTIALTIPYKSNQWFGYCLLPLAIFSALVTTTIYLPDMITFMGDESPLLQKKEPLNARLNEDLEEGDTPDTTSNNNSNHGYIKLFITAVALALVVDGAQDMLMLDSLAFDSLKIVWPLLVMTLINIPEAVYHSSSTIKYMKKHECIWPTAMDTLKALAHANQSWFSVGVFCIKGEYIYAGLYLICGLLSASLAYAENYLAEPSQVDHKPYEQPKDETSHITTHSYEHP